MSNVIDNIGLPYSGINLSYSNAGTIGSSDAEILVQLKGERGKGTSDYINDLRGVLAHYDHRSWNDSLEYPSVENICELLSAKLKDRLLFPFTLRVWEGDGKWAETDSSERDA